MKKRADEGAKVKKSKLHASEQVELVRVSLDELNLSTFPVSVLDKKAQRSREPLQFQDLIDVGGRTVERHWKVFPHQEEGFPGPADDDVLMALFELTREQGGAKKIFFTRYQLCKKLGWPLNTFYYNRIESSFRKLAGVHIEATNAFGDRDRRKFINMGFSIIQEYKLFDELAGRERLSYVLWSDRIAASISQKLTKYLDASFYFEALETPLEKRLFRYLDNQFEQSGPQVSLHVPVLCYEHLGIARRYRYISQLMQKLEEPLQKLVQKNFLARWRLENTNLIVVRVENFAARVKLSMPLAEMLEDIQAVEQSPNPKNPRPTKEAASKNTNLAEGLTEVAQSLASRGVEANVARDIAARAIGCEAQVEAALRYFDSEQAKGKRFDNPGGLLVSIIRKYLPAQSLPPTRSTSPQPLLPGISTKEDAQTSQMRAEIEYQRYLGELGRQTLASLSTLEQQELFEAAQLDLKTGDHAGKYRRMTADKFAEHLRAIVESQLSRRQALAFDEWYPQWLKHCK